MRLLTRPLPPSAASLVDEDDLQHYPEEVGSVVEVLVLRWSRNASRLSQIGHRVTLVALI